MATASSLLAHRDTITSKHFQLMDIEVLFISHIHVQYQLSFWVRNSNFPPTRHFVTVTCKSVIIILHLQRIDKNLTWFPKIITLQGE